jgi:hypothetical protein
MLNDHFMVRYSEHFAERLERERPGDPAGQIELAMLLALQRGPRLEERARFGSFIQRNGLANFCRVLLNSNEFIFLN